MLNAPVRQGQIGDEIQPADHLAHREVHHRRVDVGDQMKARGPPQYPLTVMPVRLQVASRATRGLPVRYGSSFRLIRVFSSSLRHSAGSLAQVLVLVAHGANATG